MTTDKIANTSLYIPVELKLKAQKIALDKKQSLKGVIVDLLETFVKQNS